MRHLRAERVILDVALVLAVAGAGWWRDASLAAGPDFLLPVPGWAVPVVHAASALVLLGRRRWPCAVVLAGLAVLVPTYAALVIPHALLRHGPRPVVAVAWSLLPVGAWVLGADLWADGDPLSGVLLAAAAGVAGAYARGRAEALARLAREERATARAEERRRVAAALHDAVTHSVTLVVLQAGSLAGRTSDATVRAEAQGIRGNGVRALEELRRMVTVLADPAAAPTDEALVPGGHVSDVVAEARAAGQEVSYRHLGAEPPRTGPAAAVLASVAREALANARRHASGSAVAVLLIVRDRAARLMVRNGAGETGSVDWPAGTGTGLPSARAAVAEHGGRLEAHPTPEGGFEVDVRLPLHHPGEVRSA